MIQSRMKRVGTARDTSPESIEITDKGCSQLRNAASPTSARSMSRTRAHSWSRFPVIPIAFRPDVTGMRFGPSLCSEIPAKRFSLPRDSATVGKTRCFGRFRTGNAGAGSDGDELFARTRNCTGRASVGQEDRKQNDRKIIFYPVKNK